jgi:tRNA A-37 threonylcarbamoyl transferase component Bud32
LSNIEPTPFGDKYVLVEHIATGGMAEIYRANYAGIEGFAKELVVKTLREEFAARPDVVSMFLDEARVAATLTHNNVVHTYDLGEIGGEYFIAMELLKGEELVNVMRRAHQLERRIPLELAIAIIMQSCEGLHYVHTRADETGNPLGLVHRDINPTNIHVGYDGVCKILDFGIAATRASAVAKKGQIAGKLAYMAPEQLQGRVIDARADIFPLGVVMYELCLGRRLFRGPRDEVMRRVLEGEVPPPTFVVPDFPPALEAVIMKALEVDPADRYQNCDHMFRDLEAYLSEVGLTWTPRRLSALMVELFGEGAPAEVDYDDEYDDLDGALDFDAFEGLGGDDDEAPPAWARQLEEGAAASGSAAKKVAIGNLEALVAAEVPPGDDLPPSAVVTASAADEPDPWAARDPAEVDRASGRRSKLPTSSEVRNKKSGRRARLRSPSGGRPSLTPTSGARRAITGPVAGVPDPVSGRAFGSGVVTENVNKSSSSWVWLLLLATLGGIIYVAYTLFTTK